MSKTTHIIPEAGKRYLVRTHGHDRVSSMTVHEVHEHDLLMQWDGTERAFWERKSDFVQTWWHRAHYHIIKELAPLRPTLTVDMVMAAVQRHAPVAECSRCDGMGCSRGCPPPNWKVKLRDELEAAVLAVTAENSES